MQKMGDAVSPSCVRETATQTKGNFTWGSPLRRMEPSQSLKRWNLQKAHRDVFWRVLNNNIMDAQRVREQSCQMQDPTKVFVQENKDIDSWKRKASLKKEIQVTPNTCMSTQGQKSLSLLLQLPFSQREIRGRMGRAQCHSLATSQPPACPLTTHGFGLKYKIKFVLLLGN